MNNNTSSTTLCQPSCGLSCGYYFSSGFVISDTVYSSAEHGALYNAASRVIVDGGRKVLQTAALGGMMMQNLAVPGYAGNSSGVVVSTGETSTVSAGETWTSTQLTGYNVVLNVYGSTSLTNLTFSRFSTFIVASPEENILNGGIFKVWRRFFMKYDRTRMRSRVSRASGLPTVRV